MTTRAEAEAEILSQNWKCDGPAAAISRRDAEEFGRLLQDKQFTEILGAYIRRGDVVGLVRATFGASHAQELLDAIGVDLELNDYASAAGALVRLGEGLARRDYSWRASLSQASCNYPFTQVVASGPFDGEVHEYQCPRCHVQATYRAPTYEGTR